MVISVPRLTNAIKLKDSIVLTERAIVEMKPIFGAKKLPLVVFYFI